MQRILVVEDEIPLLEEIVDQLVFAGYEVYECSDGATAIQQALECKPDAIICDISMPQMNGYEVLEHLRQVDVMRVIPFIFLTAKTDRSSMRHGMELGANDYLTKPFTRQELLATLQTHLKQAEDLRQVYMSELEQTRTELLRMITHELKTPLAGVKMTVELLDRHLDNLTLDEVRDLTVSLKYGGDRLQHIIEQLILYFQLESKYFTAEMLSQSGVTASFYTLLTTAINDARRYSFRNHDLFIDMPSLNEDIQLFCNPIMIKQALTELIINALNFSPHSGIVTIKLKPDPKYLYFMVSDQGEGMYEVQIREALKPFRQLKRETQEQQGIGIGLTLTNQIINLHGGNLQIRSRVGHGTRAAFQLPLR